MTQATDIATEWNAVVTDWGDTITLYNPTLTYNDENDIDAYTLDAGTSTTAIVLLDADGITYNSNIEGIGDSLSLRVLFSTTESVDEETMIKVGSDYFRVAQGSLRKPKFDDTVIAQRAILRKMMGPEVAKIA
jgi:hypothetical protein